MAYKTASRAYCMAKTQLSVLRELYNWELRRTIDPEGNETNDSLGIIQLYQSTEEVFGRPCLKTSYGLYVIDVLDFVFDGLDAVVYDNDANDMGTVYWKMIPIGQLATREFAEKNNYTLTNPSNEYDSNRIIREVDVLKKEKISVYYLSSLFTVKGEDNRVETPSSINLEVVPNWQNTDEGHFSGSKTGSVSNQRQWCDRMIQSIPGGWFKVTINKDLPVYIYRLAVVTLDGSYISSWDLNDSQSGSFSFTASADCAVIMDWYYPYSIKSDYTLHTNSQGPTPHDWVAVYGANDVLTYSKTWCDIEDVETDTDEYPILDALNAYADFLKGTIYSGDSYPKGELPPALLSRNTRCKLSLHMARDSKSSRPVVENIRIYDPGSWELLEVLNEANCTDYYDNMYIWEYTMTRPILVSSSVSSSAGVPRIVDVTIDYAPTVSITDIQGHVGDITQVDTNTIKLLVNSYSILKIQYTSLFVSKVSMSDSHRWNLYMPGTVLWTERFIHEAHGGNDSSYSVYITADVPACIFSGLYSVDIPNTTIFSGGDNPIVRSVSRYGDINKGYVYTKFNELINRNYTNIPNQFSLNVSVQELSFYSDTGSSSSFNIPNYIFSGCDALKTFDLNLKNNPPVYFGSYAFYLCPSLKNVDIPNNTKSFGEGCFMLSGIESFACPPDITTIADKLALSCRNLSTVKLTEATGLLSIGKMAFSSLLTTNSEIDDVVSSLKTVTVPQSVKTIKGYAFSGNYLLDGITTNPMSTMISGSNMFIFNVDSSFKNNMNTIEEGVFSHCTGLRHVILPSSIHTIDTKAFDSCNSIFYFNSPGLKIVMNDAFKNTWIEGTTSSDMELVLEGTTYGEGGLYKKTGTTGILFDIPGTDLGGLNTNYTKCTYISPTPDNTSLILYKCNDKQLGGTGSGRYLYSLHHKTISISPYAFSGNYDFGNIGCYSHINTGVSLDVLNYIGDFAFRSNTRLKAFTFPLNGIVNYLGEGAFYGCTRLSEIGNFKQQPITEIKDYTFYNCGDDKYGIGASTDTGYCNLEFYIPYTTTSIGNYAFAKCPLLMGIANLANCNITSIGEGAFLGCFLNTAWQSVENKRIALLVAGIVMAAVGIIATFGTSALALTGGEITLLGVDWSAKTAGFVGGAMGTSLGGLVIADNDDATTPSGAELWLPKVTNIGKAAFKDCSYLTTVIVSDELTTIAADTFNSCERLHDLQGVPSTYNFGDTEDVYTSLQVTYIGERAFKGCKNLSMYTMAHLLRIIKVIGNDAFFGANLDEGMLNKQIIIPNSIRILGTHSLHLDNLYKNHTRDWVFIHQDPTQIVCGTDVFPSKHINIHIPAGSLNNYLQAFPNLTSDKFTEIDLNDLFWHKLKEAGYSVPWLTD